MASTELRQSGRRKRGRQTQGADDALEQFVELAADSKKMVVFTGSGISANSGMSMFSTRNGLYERARKRFKITDGIKLFSYPFYKQRKADVQAFFAEIYSEAQASRASPGHHALSQLNALGRLQRHYTLNIDGLAEIVGLDTWHHEDHPNGSTVEMHGNIRDMVCPECHATEPLTRSSVNTMKQSRPVMCSKCPDGEMRFKVMLYDDEQGDCITPEDVFEQLEEDLGKADMVVWVGISFEQSASTEYFRKVRHLLSSIGRSQEVRQVIINPSDEALFNVLSSLANREDVEVLEVLSRSDDALPLLMDRLRTTIPEETKHAVALASAAAEAAVERRTLQLRRSRSPPAQQQEFKLPPLWLNGRSGLAKDEEQPQQEAVGYRPHPEQLQQQQQKHHHQQQQQQQQGTAGRRAQLTASSDAAGLLGSTVLAATTALWGPVTNGVGQQPALPLFQHHNGQALQQQRQQQQQQRPQQLFLQQQQQQQHAATAIMKQENIQKALAALSPSAEAGPSSAALAAATAALASAGTGGFAAGLHPSLQQHWSNGADRTVKAEHYAAAPQAAGSALSNGATVPAALPLKPEPSGVQSRSAQSRNNGVAVSSGGKPGAAGTVPSGSASALALLVQALGPQAAAMVAAAAAGSMV